jgi:hypothetical protein
MADPFETLATGKDSPANFGAAVTPDDSTDLATLPRGLFIGGAGDVVVHDTAGTSLTFTCPAGAILPLRAARVLATGTTATGIVALW